MRVAKPITLSEQDRTTLTKWSRGRSTPARLVQRAKIILAAAEGRENKDIAVELGCTRRTVGIWRHRFAADGIAGIEKDAPRPGRRAVVREEKEAEIIRKTTQETPPHATQWSVRTMAKAMGVSKDTVRRVWRDNGLKPHRTKTFKVSNDPHFVDKLVDVVGLYLNPPEHALVLSCDIGDILEIGTFSRSLGRGFDPIDLPPQLDHHRLDKREVLAGLSLECRSQVKILGGELTDCLGLLQLFG